MPIVHFSSKFHSLLLAHTGGLYWQLWSSWGSLGDFLFLLFHDFNYMYLNLQFSLWEPLSPCKSDM